MRLFVAGYPAPAALDDLATAVANLAVARAAGDGVNARLTPASRWHLTLAFLGEVPERRLPGVPRTVARAVSRWREDGGKPPELRLGGGGTFGRGRFTVLWVGLQGQTGPLVDLAEAVRANLHRARLSSERSAFRPHLTLARPGDRLAREAIAGDVAQLGGYLGPSWTLTELCLVSSELGPSPVHRTVHRFPLGD